MIIPKTPSVVVLLALLVPLRVMSADAVRIAVLAGEGERAPKAGVVDLLMVELSKRPDVVVLEREEIGKILAEQKLNTSELMDRTQSIRMGVLLGADALLAVERLGQVQDESRQYRVKVIEAQTGLVAGDRFFNGPKVEQEPAIMAAEMDRNLAWLRIPGEGARYRGQPSRPTHSHTHILTHSLIRPPAARQAVMPNLPSHCDGMRPFRRRGRRLGGTGLSFFTLLRLLQNLARNQSARPRTLPIRQEPSAFGMGGMAASPSTGVLQEPLLFCFRHIIENDLVIIP